MASTYAHYKFGQEVLSSLPDHIKSIISQGKQLYDIGLHGPDILFYHKPLKSNEIKDFGHELHKIKAGEILTSFAEILKENPSAEKTAYIFGFISHFALDSSIHRYVEDAIAPNGLSHTEIETGFEYFLLDKDGHDPTSKKLTSHIISSSQNAENIKCFYPKVTLKEMKKSLKSIHFYHNLYTAPKNPKRAVIVNALKLLGLYESYGGVIMPKSLNEKQEKINQTLYFKYQKAVSLAVFLITNYQEYLTNNATLDDRFYHTFGWEDNE